MRAETKSDDVFVRRWRPTWGYVTAFTWATQSIAIAAAIIWSTFVTPEFAGEILGAITSLTGAMTAMWATALAVLGINIHSRSQDKKVEAATLGVPLPTPRPLLDRILNR